jgi:Voltage gated chloride channel
MPSQALMVIGAAGSFTALAFIFTSPLIAAVILIEAAGLGGPKLRLVLIPGLLAAGIGTLVSLGIGSLTGLSSSAYALGPLSLSDIGRLKVGEFGWTILLAIAIAVGTRVVMQSGMFTYRFVSRRMLFVLLPLIALIIAGIAIGFSEASGKSIDYVLFDGQNQMPGLVEHAGAWSLGTLAFLVLCKGIAYALSLGSFRGGPTFPALFLGAAAGIMASQLPGFPEGAGVAVGIAASVTGVLRLPLSAVVLATLLTTHAGSSVEPLIIVGAVVAYVVTALLSRSPKTEGASASEPSDHPGKAPGPEPEPAGAS